LKAVVICILKVLNLVVGYPSPSFRRVNFWNNLNFPGLVGIMVLKDNRRNCPTFAYKPTLILEKVKLFNNRFIFILGVS
jgi:hypothetical protein